MRWLLRRSGICPNAYYNYRKHRKAGHHAPKAQVLARISEIYHNHNGVDGYRSMTVYLARCGCHYSYATIHEFQTEEALYQAIEESAYVSYNHVRPHSFNGYRTLYQARVAP